jgi:AcrR family transcriptional regulator
VGITRPYGRKETLVKESRRAAGGAILDTMSAPGPPRQRNRRGEGDRLRADIVRAATDLLAGLGDDDALSLRAVAREAGVTAPSLYLHFADKAELVEAVLGERFGELDATLEAAAAGLDDPGERLTARAHAFVGFGLAHPGHFKVMYEGRDLAALRQVPWPGNGRGIQDRVESDVAALMTAGRVPAADPAGVALLLWQGLHGVVALRISKTSVAWGAVRDDTDAMVRALVHV